ncbi:MAG: hypothetical protein GY762_11195 [Proteobacteria bacterium]|nr:hypothetical protein [Pseudomonadota bacterium]
MLGAAIGDAMGHPTEFISSFDAICAKYGKEGANTPGDSDSIATMAGALVVARCGIGSIPTRWVQDIERCKELFELATAAYSVGQT